MSVSITELIASAIIALPPTLVALAGWRKSSLAVEKVQEVHLSLNSRLTQLLTATEGVARAEGTAAGRAEVHAEQSAKE